MLDEMNDDSNDAALVVKEDVEPNEESVTEKMKQLR